MKKWKTILMEDKYLWSTLEKIRLIFPGGFPPPDPPGVFFPLGIFLPWTPPGVFLPLGIFLPPGVFLLLGIFLPLNPLGIFLPPGVSPLNPLGIFLPRGFSSLPPRKRRVRKTIWIKKGTIASTSSGNFFPNGFTSKRWKTIDASDKTTKIMQKKQTTYFFLKRWDNILAMRSMMLLKPVSLHRN